MALVARHAPRVAHRQPSESESRRAWSKLTPRFAGQSSRPSRATLSRPSWVPRYAGEPLGLLIGGGDYTRQKNGQEAIAFAMPYNLEHRFLSRLQGAE